MKCLNCSKDLKNAGAYGYLRFPSGHWATMEWTLPFCDVKCLQEFGSNNDIKTPERSSYGTCIECGIEVIPKSAHQIYKDHVPVEAWLCDNCYDK